VIIPFLFHGISEKYLPFLVKKENFFLENITELYVLKNKL